MSFRLGLTGGIACGKSTASRAFMSVGIPVIDADVISHALTALGSPLLDTLYARFGREIALEDSSLNRAALRKIVFSDESRLNALNELMHGAIRRELIAKAGAALKDAPYVVLAIPLLFENHLENLVDRILVLDAPEDVQLQRILRRDGCSEDTARSIISHQVSREYRLSHGDDIIDTGKLKDADLGARILKLHAFYLNLSHEPHHRAPADVIQQS